MMLETGATMIRRCTLLLALAGSLLSVAFARQQLSSSAVQDDTKANSAGDISGMYTFLREGEFVQLTVEDGRLSGYVSRFGDTDSDKGQFINQFFDKASLNGSHLTFNTKTVHGVWYEFTGVIITTPAKPATQEGFHVMKGTLIQHATDTKGAGKIVQRQVEFKSFPADLSKP
jgi:hypothetical protein